MSDFLEEEAEESDAEYEVGQSKRRAIVSSDEEDEEDGRLATQFINALLKLLGIWNLMLPLTLHRYSLI